MDEAVEHSWRLARLETLPGYFGPSARESVTPPAWSFGATPEHADERLEGEGDRSLAYWRRVHEEFFTEHATHDRGFSSDMPVVLECFRVVYP